MKTIIGFIKLVLVFGFMAIAFLLLINKTFVYEVYKEDELMQGSGIPISKFMYYQGRSEDTATFITPLNASYLNTFKSDYLENLEECYGKYYYDDEFIFATDVSATLSTDRKAMWEETRLNFTSGAYGNPQDIQTIVMFWQMMDALHYPGAKQALQFSVRRAEQQQMLAQQQQQQSAIENEQKLAIDALGKMNKAPQLQNQNK